MANRCREATAALAAKYAGSARPCLTANDRGDGRLRNPVAPSNAFLGFARIGGADVFDLGVCGLGIVMSLSEHESLRSSPSLCGSIGHVVAMRSEKEMVWPHASRVVARVKNKEFARVPEVDGIAHPVCIRRSSALATKSDAPIAGRRLSASDPHPAAVALQNLHPKAVSEGLVHMDGICHDHMITSRQRRSP